jgi:hypothetical protein
MPDADAVSVECTPAGDAVDVRVFNRSDTTVHVLDGERMPYLLRDADGGLLVLFGVNPPDPDLDYLGIEIPLSRPLEAGSELRHNVPLRPLVLRDHYSRGRAPLPLSGPVTMRCEVGWGETPITPENARQLSITTLLEWQRLARSGPVEIVLS